MSEPINFIPRPITTGRIIPEIGQKKQKVQNAGNQSFQEILKKENEVGKDLKFSAHVLKRIEDRKIQLTEQDVSSLQQAVSKADDKGIRESLIVMKDVAFIVNIKNKTVITAVDSQSMKENVITNIDGAVFI